MSLPPVLCLYLFYVSSMYIQSCIEKRPRRVPAVTRQMQMQEKSRTGGSRVRSCRIIQPKGKKKQDAETNFMCRKRQVRSFYFILKRQQAKESGDTSRRKIKICFGELYETWRLPSSSPIDSKAPTQDPKNVVNTTAMMVKCHRRRNK